jgi:hypothetical protein
MFKLTIELGNAAMCSRSHLKLALESVALVVRRDNRTEGKIQDANGNTVGRWELDLSGD